MRPFTEDDVDDFYEYSRNPDVGPRAGWKPHENREESLEIIKSFIAEDEVWALELKSTHKVAGSVGVPVNTKAKEYDNCRELGYALGKDYWGQGLMPEAARAAMNYAFSELKADTLIVSHFPFNLQSKRVIEKLGFRYSHHLKGSWLRYDGVTLDEEVYILHRDEFDY